MTLIELVEQVSQRLQAAGLSFGHGTDNAFDEAAWLVLWRLGLPLDALDEHADLPVDADGVARVDALAAERIATRRPAAYLTGEAWLQGVPFFVDERVIVPRSLIAEPLADGLLDRWVDGPAPSVLDLCTGNASLAVLAALAWPHARIQATELSVDALAVAQRNVERHGLQAHIELRQGDGLAAVAGTFDLILCNPPYVNASSMQRLPAEYRAEPALALAGGVDGMDFVRHVIAGVAASMKPGAMLVLEIGHEREHFEQAFPTLQPIWLPTSAGDDQVLMLAREDLA